MDLFVTGNDTEVGKSVVTACLAQAARADGRCVVAAKPVASGVPEGEAGEDASLLETARTTLANDPASLFSGLAPRCLLFGTTIGGQYLLYDFWTRVFRVSPDDLNLVLDVFADRISFYGT